MVSGIISKLGCDLARNLMPGNFANAKGYFESHPIAIFNDQLLTSTGSNWKDFQRVTPAWFVSPHAVAARAKALELIEEEFGSSAFFLLKDPRMCRLMPFWRDALAAGGVTPLTLHIHRSPLAVAGSLAQRDSMPRDYSLLLWLRNVLEAENDTRNLTRHFVSYEKLLESWGRETDRMAKSFGMEWPRLTDTVAGEIRDFVARDLVHHDHPPESVTGDPSLSEWIRDTFTILERWSQVGENAADRDRLDAIRSAFDQSMPAFAGLTKLSLDMQAETERLRSALDEQRDAVETASRQRAAADTEVAGWRQTSAELQQRIDQAAAEERTHEVALAELQGALKEQQAAHASALDGARAETGKLALTFREESKTMAAAHREQIAALAATHDARSTEQRMRLSHLEEELRAANAHRDSLRASTSWRITSPLRRLSLLVRRR